MTGSPSAIISMGLGSWGNPSLMITLGYGQGAAAAQATPDIVFTLPARNMNATLPQRNMNFTLPKR